MSDRRHRRQAGLPREVVAAAATWLALHDAGLDSTAAREFAAWRDADPQHAAAWAQLTAAWSRLDRQALGGDADAMILELATRRRRKRRARLHRVSLAATLGCFVAGLLLFRQPHLFRDQEAVPPATDVVAVEDTFSRRQALPDGSLVEFRGDAAIEVHFSEARRAVTLVRGEAHFSVSKDRARPFVVTARGVDVKAVGTAFAVRVEPDRIDVLVTEGEIEVGRPPALQGKAVMAAAPLAGVAGERVIVPLATVATDTVGIVERVGLAELERQLAWRGTRVEFSSTSLAEAIAVFNGRGTARLVLVDPRLADVRLSGVFNAGNHAGFVRLLTTHYGVSATQLASGEIALSRSR